MTSVAAICCNGVKRQSSANYELLIQAGVLNVGGGTREYSIVLHTFTSSPESVAACVATLVLRAENSSVRQNRQTPSE